MSPYSMEEERLQHGVEQGLGQIVGLSVLALAADDGVEVEACAGVLDLDPEPCSPFELRTLFTTIEPSCPAF